MYLSSDQLFSNAVPESRFQKIVQFPLIRVIVAVLFLLPFLLLSNLFAAQILEKLSEPYFTLIKYARDLISFITVLFCYSLYTKFIEKRNAFEISFNGFLTESGIGLLISFSIALITVIILSISGYYQIVFFNNFKPLLSGIFHFGFSALLEEILIRLIIFKLLEEFAGSWIALILTGVVFGFGHIGNPNATIGTSIGLILSDTVLMAAAFMLTRRIWMVWGIHFGWNFSIASIFGIPCSGRTYESLILADITGPDWITGGDFGIEASYIQIFISFAAGLYILKKVIKKGQIVAPLWKRNITFDINST